MEWILGAVALFGVFMMFDRWETRRNEESRRFREEAVGRIRHRPISAAGLRAMILEVYRADYSSNPDEWASYDQRLLLAGYLWKGGQQPDAQAVLLDIARSEFESFLELRLFVQWYNEVYSSQRRESEARLGSRHRFKRKRYAI